MATERSNATWGGLIRNVLEGAASQRSVEEYKMVGRHFYGMGRWILGTVLHPVAATRAILLIGDEKSITRDVETTLSLPRFTMGKPKAS